MLLRQTPRGVCAENVQGNYVGHARAKLGDA